MHTKEFGIYGASDGKESSYRETRSLGQEDPLEKEVATHSSLLCLGNPVNKGAWWAMVHGVAKSQI